MDHREPNQRQTIEAIADEVRIAYERRDRVTVRRVLPFGAHHVDVWRDGAAGPTFQGIIHAAGLNGWHVQVATGRAHTKTDVLRNRGHFKEFDDALAVLIGHESQRPIKQPWDDQAAAAARASVDSPEAFPIVLPHSGLRVPHLRLAVTSLRQFEMSRGVAFTATLRLDGRIVGTIEDEGRGGGPMFHPRDYAAFGHAAIDAFAAQCQTTWGENGTESVLGALVDEYDTGRIVAKNAAAGRLTCRLMSPIVDGSTDLYCSEMATYNHRQPPGTDGERAALARSCQRLVATGPGQTWQVWDADARQWIDLHPEAGADDAKP